MAIRQVDQRLQKLANEQLGSGSMGTTLVVWQRADRRSALIAHVGDSRCYREHHGHLTQITRDHSVVQMQVDAELISSEDAFTASNRHLITQAIGLGEPLSIDVVESPLASGDRFLLCSDGLTDMVSPNGLAELFKAHKDNQTLADALLNAALDAGGRDNVSLILIGI